MPDGPRRRGSLPAFAAYLLYAGGSALFFASYSTFLTRPGLYLEDLFVIDSERGRGIGSALLRAVARVAVDRGAGRLEWAVLDWNVPSIAFYERLGGRALDDWRTFRLTGAALEQLGGHDPSDS